MIRKSSVVNIVVSYTEHSSDLYFSERVFYHDNMLPAASCQTYHVSATATDGPGSTESQSAPTQRHGP